MMTVTITMTISGGATKLKIQPAKIRKNIRKFIVEAQKKISGNFFIWICEHCQTAGCIGYEDGDDPQIIAGHIVSAHQKEAKPGCEQDILIFDHRGMEQKDSELYLSSLKVAA